MFVFCVAFSTSYDKTCCLQSAEEKTETVNPSQKFRPVRTLRTLCGKAQAKHDLFTQVCG